MFIELGKALKEARLDLNLSLTQLQLKTGVSRQMIHSVEMGIRSGKSLIVLLKFFRDNGVDLNQLFDLPERSIDD